MNPQWPNAQYSVPSPNVPVTYAAQQLQQNSCSAVNSNAAPQSVVCSQSSNANLVCPMSVFTSIPPPSLTRPLQNVASFQFNALPPPVFPSNVPPSNASPSNFLLPHDPPPRSVIISSSNVPTSLLPLIATAPPLPSDPPPPLPHDSPPPVPHDSPPPVPHDSPPPVPTEPPPPLVPIKPPAPVPTDLPPPALTEFSSIPTKSSPSIQANSSLPAPSESSSSATVESSLHVHTNLPPPELIKPSPSEPIASLSHGPPASFSGPPASFPSEASVQIKSALPLVDSSSPVQLHIHSVPHSLKQTVLPHPIQTAVPPPQIVPFPSVQPAAPSPQIAPFPHVHTSPSVQTVPAPMQAVLHPPVPTAPSPSLFLPIRSVPPSTVESTAIPCLNQSLPTVSFPIKAATSFSKVNLSLSHAFTVPPPSAGTPQPYLNFPVQGTSSTIRTHIPPTGFVSQKIQGNTSMNTLNQTPLQISYPSCTGNVALVNINGKSNYSSGSEEKCHSSHKYKSNHFSPKEKYNSSRNEKYHSSHKEERYHSSHIEERRHSSSKERHSSSYKEEKSCFHKERHHSSHKEERHHSSHKERHHSSHKEERHHSSHKEKHRHRLSHKEEQFHKEGRHHSSHREGFSPHKERHFSSQKERYHSVHKEKNESSHKEKQHSSDKEGKSKDSHTKSESLLKDDINCDLTTENCDSKQKHTGKSTNHSDPKSHEEDGKHSSRSSRSCSRKRTPPCNVSGSNKKRKNDSKVYSPSKRTLMEGREGSYKREMSRSRSEQRSNQLRSNRDQRNKERLQKLADQHRNSRLAKRRRSSTPKDLPCLSPKNYKYIASTPAVKYYSPKEEGSKEIIAKDRLKELHEYFKYELVDRAERIRAVKPKYEPPKRKTKLRKPKPPKTESNSDTSSSEKTSSDEEDTAMEELERKKKHPDRLHLELWFNDPKEMNDGPLCRCSAKARRAGIRHGIYVGEDHLPLCDAYSNNPDRLYHYRITMTPHTNFLTKNPTTIQRGGHEYRFEGFSMFSHLPLPQWPNCKVIRFNYEYTILYIEEEFPKNFTIQGLELFNQYLLTEILELVDLNWKAHDDPDGCPRFHFMPRFTRELEDGGKEILAHAYVLEYLLKQNQVLIKEDKIEEILSLDDCEWQYVADEVKGMIVTCPGMKPSSIRVDQLDREQCLPDKEEFPVIVHFGVRPPQLSYAGNPHYQKAWRDYVKYRHLLANKPKVRYADRHRLNQKESRLQEMRMENDLKRDVTVVINSKNFYKTGIMSDIIQHAMLLPVLVCHLRFHQSLAHLEEKLGYKFQDRFLLQLALTHPSYRENFGTNPDHARNSLTNCGLRQPQYGDRRIHYMNTRKRGINTLINIMSRFGSRKETLSRINHNERLEFLGDAVVEFLSSIHLFYMFPDLEEGGLATYRAAIVQNQHLAVLSKKLELDRFMLYAHGSDLCHDLELRHAMANCFEALMGALFLDNGIEIADKVFSKTLFSEPELLEVWKNFSPHPLQEQEPDGDRKWIASVPLLKNLHNFEKAIGIEFNHIRLLARALTHRSLGYNNLTLGSNQRLEFLGDTVLQLVASEYLYKFFPEHHEGHLSLLRSSLVNNRTQAVVCADLGMVEYAIYPYSKVELKPKDKADLLEAFLGALYVDKDLGYCRKFCEVCFFPRLQDFIMNQDWNDPKSKLQQCCLTLRSMDGGEPDIPTYKVIECKGPTNTRVYSVAVYFQGNRLAVGSGHSIQQAEMDAAANALKKSKDLFPQLRHQRRAIERSLKQGPPKKGKSASKDPP